MKKKQKVFLYLLLFSLPFLGDYFLTYRFYGRPAFLMRILVALNSDRLDVFLGEISSIQIRILGSGMRTLPVGDNGLAEQFRATLNVTQPRYLPLSRENPKISIEFLDAEKKGSGSFFLYFDEGPYVYFQINGTEAPNSPKYDGRWIYFKMTPEFRRLVKAAIGSVTTNSVATEVEKRNLQPFLELL